MTETEGLRGGLAPLSTEGGWREPEYVTPHPIIRSRGTRQSRLGGLKIAIAGFCVVTSATLGLGLLVPNEMTGRFALTDGLLHGLAKQSAFGPGQAALDEWTRTGLDMTRVAASGPLIPLERAMSQADETAINMAATKAPLPVIPAPLTGPRFIVRFENAPEAERILRLYRESRSAARLAFADYAQAEQNLQGFSLVGLTPSGEAVLSWDSLDADRQAAPPIDALVERLNAQTGVRYADPNVWTDAASG